jgi:hypothetical protein
MQRRPELTSIAAVSMKDKEGSLFRSRFDLVAKAVRKLQLLFRPSPRGSMHWWPWSLYVLSNRLLRQSDGLSWPHLLSRHSGVTLLDPEYRYLWKNFELHLENEVGASHGSTKLSALPDWLTWFDLIYALLPTSLYASITCETYMVTQYRPEKHSAQRHRVCLAYHNLLRMSDVLGTALVDGQVADAREVGFFLLLVMITQRADTTPWPTAVQPILRNL